MVQNVIQSRMAGVISTLTLKPQEHQPLLRAVGHPRGVRRLEAGTPEGEGLGRQCDDGQLRREPTGWRPSRAAWLPTEWLLLIYPSRWSTRVERERGMRAAAARHRRCQPRRHRERERRRSPPGEKRSQHITRLDGGHDSAGPGGGQQPDASRRVAPCCVSGRSTLPDDCAVIAFDEFAWAPLLDPPLTVLNEHSEQIGVRASDHPEPPHRRPGPRRAEPACSIDTPVPTGRLPGGGGRTRRSRKSCGC